MDFLKEVIRNPKRTGAVAPSSRQLAGDLVERAELGSATCVVELGPGTGALTREVLAGLPEGAAYLAIELNGKFAELLGEKYPGVVVREGSAERIGEFLGEAGHASCDRVISGIPWTVLPEGEDEKIVAKVAEALAPGGLFLTLAYFPMNRLPRGKAFKELLGRHFSSVEETDVVPANIPPAFVYVCRR